MSDLAALMNLKGALAAFTFSDSGELESHEVAEGSELDGDVLDLLAHVIVANLAIATMQARGWEKLTSQSGFYPIEGFTLMGFEWTTVANGNRGVVIKNDDVDYEAAYAALAN
jgi:roadblock/LC7 domain-containing protein